MFSIVSRNLLEFLQSKHMDHMRRHSKTNKRKLERLQERIGSNISLNRQITPPIVYIYITLVD